MARKKYKFDKEQKKIYKVEIDKNIVESSSVPEDEKKKKARDEQKARRARRRASRTKHKLAVLSGANNTPQEKRYDVHVMYHQLNYAAIQEALKELDMKPVMINSQYLILNDVSQEDFEKAKEAFIKCHFKTKQGKEYKVRIAGYKHNTILKINKEEKKSHTNNTPEVAAKAKALRKTKKKEAFKNRKPHTSYRSRGEDHKPGTKDTSNKAKRLSERVKKACNFIKKKEENKEKEAERIASKRAPKHKPKAVQKKIKFAA